MEALQAKFKDWHPRAVVSDTDQHLDKMLSVGTKGGKFYCNPLVSGLSAILIWAFVIWAAVEKETMADDTADAQSWVTDIWNWLYMISQNIWILVLFWLLFKHFNMKLGKDEEEPEFSDLTYFAMLFSCGVATGLWYYSAEAMWHYEGYGTPRWTDQYMFNDNTRAEHAMMVTWFHWGLHGWIPYVVVGALISILSYRRGFPMSMRFTMYPIIGELVYGPLGDMIEVLSILCTIFGVCTSLGLGAMQINKGLVRLDLGTYHGINRNGCDVAGQNCTGNTGMEVNRDTQCVIIVIITAMAVTSVILGLKAGIALLSQIAFILSFFILFAILFLDETWYILNALTSTLGYYIWYLPKISFHTDAWEELGKASDGLGGAPDGRGGLKGWMNGWTIFYWGWWISWGPFVGTFLARISKGRKLGPFIIASLVLPSFWSFVFTGIFGASQIRISRQAEAAGLDMSDSAHTYGSLADKDVIGWNTVGEDGITRWVPVGDNVVRLYNLATEDVVFEHMCYYGSFGFGTFMTVITLICVVLYFVTSSDSASYVVDILAANGLEEPPTIQKVFWGCTEGVAAIALLLSADEENPSAALNAVKAIPIILGLPFTFMLFWMCQALMIVCSEEAGKMAIERKNFRTWVFNLEIPSLISFVVPFVPAGQVAAKVWGGNPVVYMVGYASLWVTLIVFFCLTAADEAFLSLAAASYFVLSLAVGGMRTAVRHKLGITGDMISDAMVGVFAFPWAIGQMAVEEFTYNEKEVAM